MHSLRLLWGAHNESAWLRRQRRYSARLKLENVEDMPETFFIEHFRLNKSTFKQLCRDLRIYTALRGSLEISLEIKVRANL